jgi:hypothetical protein
MTTQGVTFTTGNQSMSKIFSNAAATDGQWTANTLTDTIAGQQIGILIPNSPLGWGQLEYEAGVCAYRVQNAQSLAVATRGFGVLGGFNEATPTSLKPSIRVNPNDIVSVYPLAVAGALQSSAMAWVWTSMGCELFANAGIADGVSTEIKSAVNEQTLGDMFFNSRLNTVCVQVQDGSKLNFVEIIDEMGGTVMTLQGGKRGITVGGTSNLFNLEVTGLNIPVGKGWTMKFNTSTV